MVNTCQPIEHQHGDAQQLGCEMGTPVRKKGGVRDIEGERGCTTFFQVLNIFRRAERSTTTRVDVCVSALVARVSWRSGLRAVGGSVGSLPPARRRLDKGGGRREQESPTTTTQQSRRLQTEQQQAVSGCAGEERKTNPKQRKLMLRTPMSRSRLTMATTAARQAMRVPLHGAASVASCCCCRGNRESKVGGAAMLPTQHRSLDVTALRPDPKISF